MRDTGKALLLIITWLACAGNVMIALFLLGRALSGLVGRWRTRVRGAARVNRPGGRTNMVSEPWTDRVVGVGRKVRSRAQAPGDARPPREGVKNHLA